MKVPVIFCILISISLLVLCENEKILLGPFLAGSHEAKFHQVGLALREAGFNVTIMVPESSANIPMYDKDGIYTLQWDGLTKEYFDWITLNMSKSGRSEDAVLGLEINHKSSTPEWVTFVKNQKYDLFIRTQFPYFCEVALILDIPNAITIDSVLPDMWFTTYNQKQIVHSTIGALLSYFLFPNPIDYDIATGLTFTQRLKNKALGIFISFPFIRTSQKVGKTIVSPEYSNLIDQAPKPTLILSTNVETMFQHYPTPPYMKYLFPMYKEQLPQNISTSIVDFLTPYEKRILFCFGSMFTPKEDLIKAIREFAQTRSNYGIIFCSKQSFETMPDNVKTDIWVPQKELLNSGLIDYFYGHGGINSILEALEAAVPVLVTPLSPTDQFQNCDFLQRQKFGICLTKPTSELIMNSLDKIDRNKDIQENLKVASKIIKMDKKNRKDLLYWIRYVLDVGIDHLVPNDTIALNLIELADIDVHFVLFTIGLVVFYAIYALVKKLFCPQYS